MSVSKKEEIEAVEVLSKSEGLSPVELISKLQATACAANDEKTLSRLCVIKNHFIESES